MVDIKRGVLLAALAIIAASGSTVSVADEKIEGKVIGTNLTLCHPRPNGGGCEGTLTLEAKPSGSVVIKVIADTIIKKGERYIFLPQTEDNPVVVTFVTEKGQKVAKSIDVVDIPR